ncbi:hypothetical protein D3C80_1341430 [compost metagenome]
MVGITFFSQLGSGKATDQYLRQRPWCQAIQEAAGFIQDPQRHFIRHNLLIQYPFSGFGQRQGFGQQVVHFHHIYAVFAHLGHKVKMVTLGALNPQHVIK